MKTSGLFTVHRHAVKVKSGEPLRLVLFGDVHRDAPGHAATKWKEFLAYAAGLRNAIFLGMGDYLDSTSTTERNCLGKISAELHETLANDIQALQMEKVKLIAKELSFMRGRLVGMLNGNHYFQFGWGSNTDQEICKELGAQYLGVCSFIRLSISCGSKREVAVDIFAHHGAGGARLPGGSINRVNQLHEYAAADIVAMGHDHKRGVFPANPVLSLTSAGGKLRVEERQKWVARTGSFLASYEPGTRNYNVDAGRGPASLGHVEFELTATRNHSGGSDEMSLSIRGIA